MSSVHFTFNTEEEWRTLAGLGFLQRMGIQFHWSNEGYSTFDDFLMQLKQPKRKNIRQVRWALSRSSASKKMATLIVVSDLHSRAVTVCSFKGLCRLQEAYVACDRSIQVRGGACRLAYGRSCLVSSTSALQRSQ